MPAERRERIPPRGGVTEAANPRTADLDCLPLGTVLDRILEEDASVPGAVRAELPRLEAAATLLQETLEGGGRWINLGAGTSGRIGVLDAAEIPPTFGLPPDRVRGIIAGGKEALRQAVEGAEDDVDAARRDLEELDLSPGDALVALSASGRTPYVIAGLRLAREVGARTVGVTCDPDSPLALEAEAPIVVRVGPEVIAGSTRMKGGLAQKMVLHALSTAVMVRMGRVRGNLMSDIRAINAKLRVRAVRTLVRLCGIGRDEAERRLEEADGSLGIALDRFQKEHPS
jgi:N-acetylmuramic acid 6-phosphate etherase